MNLLTDAQGQAPFRPVVPPPYQILAELFEPKWVDNAHLIDRFGEADTNWSGYRVRERFPDNTQITLPPDRDVYFAVGMQSRESTGRRNGNVTRDYLIVLDDVGVKSDRAIVDGLAVFGMEPVMVVETSPGSFQYFFRLDEPVLRLDPDHKDRLALLELIRAKLADKNAPVRLGDTAVHDPARIMRLPFGVNSKPKYRREDGSFPPVKLDRWNPGARVTLEQWAELLLGADWQAQVAAHTPGARPASAILGSSTGDRHASMDDVYVRLAARVGLNPHYLRPGVVGADCPNAAAHTNGDPSGFAFINPYRGHCQHDHCQHLSAADFMELIERRYEEEIVAGLASGELTKDPETGLIRDKNGDTVPATGRSWMAHDEFIVRSPLTPADLEAVDRAISAHQAGTDWLRRMNRRYALVPDVARVIDREPGPDSLLRYIPLDFFRVYHNELVSVPGLKRPVGIGQAWLKDPRSARFDTIAMHEPGTEPAGVLNPYAGLPTSSSWAAVQSATRFGWQPIVDFITEVIAARRQNVADYVLNWLAWKVQHPLLKPGVNLVLIGKQGTGKTFFAELVIDIFGPRLALSVTQERHALGNFNAHLLHKLLVVFDEAFYARDPKAKGTYKNLTTQDRMLIERKGIDAQQATNHLGIIVTSNELASVPVEPDDRRATVMRVSEHRRQDNAYFAALTEAWVNGAREAFIDYLRQRDVSAFDPRRPLSTPEKGEVAAATGDLATQFWRDILDHGRHPVRPPRTAEDWEGGRVFICDGDLYEDFRVFAAERGQRMHLPSPAELHDRLAHLCPGRSERHAKGPRVGGKQGPGGRYYPRLEDCRTELLRAMEGAQAIPLAAAA